jgi:hypothetical protein
MPAWTCRARRAAGPERVSSCLHGRPTSEDLRRSPPPAHTLRRRRHKLPRTRYQARRQARRAYQPGGHVRAHQRGHLGHETLRRLDCSTAQVLGGDAGQKGVAAEVAACWVGAGVDACLWGVARARLGAARAGWRSSVSGAEQGAQAGRATCRRAPLVPPAIRDAWYMRRGGYRQSSRSSCCKPDPRHSTAHATSTPPIPPGPPPSASPCTGGAARRVLACRAATMVLAA